MPETPQEVRKFLFDAMVHVFNSCQIGSTPEVRLEQQNAYETATVISRAKEAAAREYFDTLAAI